MIRSDVARYTVLDYFLCDAGIPDNVTEEYGSIFIGNRITEKAIQTVTDDHLRSLKIEVLGDRLAILAHAN